MPAPDGFVTYNGHHYKYVKGLFPFAEAQAGAAAAGGYVATITSAGENAFLANLIAGQDLGAWLGGSDSAVEGTWVWTEGPDAGSNFWNGLSGGSTPADQYSNWSIGEPNGIWNGLEEDHLHMMANSAKWNDTSGQWATMGYFIEIDGTPGSSGNAAPVITSNGGGAAAVSIAENTSAVTTVTATDADADALVFSISGGADAAQFTINAATGALAFASAPDFEAPSDAGGNNVYDVTVTATDAQGAADTQALAASVTDVSESGGSGPAPDGFVTYNGHHYKFTAGHFTHSQAKDAAEAAGGYLASITSAGENAFLASLMASTNAGGYGGWLGGSDAAGEGAWQWTEGPDAGSNFWNGTGEGSAPGGAHASWLSGQPSGYYADEEDHMHMLAGTDKWNDIPDAYWITMGYFTEIG